MWWCGGTGRNGSVVGNDCESVSRVAVEVSTQDEVHSRSFFRSRGFQWKHMGRQNLSLLRSRSTTCALAAAGYY